VFGAPLKRSQIKGYWGKLKNKTGPMHLPTIKKEGQYYDHLTMPELKKYIQSVARENKTELMCRLAKMDAESGFKFSLEHGWQIIEERQVQHQQETYTRISYDGLKVAELRTLCKERNLHVSGRKRDLLQRLREDS